MGNYFSSIDKTDPVAATVNKFDSTDFTIFEAVTNKSNN